MVHGLLCSIELCMHVGSCESGKKTGDKLERGDIGTTRNIFFLFYFYTAHAQNQNGNVQPVSAQKHVQLLAIRTIRHLMARDMISKALVSIS